jgi:hypothetical protein
MKEEVSEVKNSGGIANSERPRSCFIQSPIKEGASLKLRLLIGQHDSHSKAAEALRATLPLQENASARMQKATSDTAADRESLDEIPSSSRD